MKNKQYNLKTILISLIILGMCTFHWINGSKYIFYAAILIALISSLTMNIEDFLIVYTILIPNVTMLKMRGVSVAVLGYIGLFFAFRLFFSRRRRNIFPATLFIPVAINMLFLMFTVIKTQNNSLLMSEIRLLGVLIISLWIIENEDGLSKTVMPKTIDAYIFGCTINVIFGAVYFLAKNRSLLINLFSGINNDRNYFAIMLAFGIQFSLLQMYRMRKIDVRYSVMFCIMLAGGIVSGSRTFIILGILMIITLLIVVLSIKEKGYILIIIPLILVVVHFMANTFLAGRLAYALSRFSDSDVQSGNGRVEMWGFYIGQVTYSIFNLLFGVGSSAKAISLGLVQSAEHNSFIQALYETGAFGLLSYIAIYLNVAKLVLKKTRILFLSILPMISFLVGYCTVSAYNSDIFNYDILLCIILIKIVSKNGEEELQ